METNDLVSKLTQDSILAYLREERLFNSQVKFNTALAKVQGELGGARKDQSGYGYQYSDLSSVINTAKPVLAKHGFAISQPLKNTEGKIVSIETILSHADGSESRHLSSMPVISMKGCNDAQNVGATVSYLRRYAYQSILGMPSEDNDASSEGFKKTSKPVTKEVSNGTTKESSKSFRRSGNTAAAGTTSDDI